MLYKILKSHASRVRGLKPNNKKIKKQKNKSHASRVRGLKRWRL
ncbi:MAG: hypothetical protein IGBAC_0145 [Ignavibacteriae bacterium]|nr:MAG: hypothetical protein IGBAC_0145 [Ignavibacteriota bacterium]